MEKVIENPRYAGIEMGFPIEWETRLLGDIYSCKNGVNADKASYGSGVPFINVMEVINHSRIREEQIPGTVSVSQKILESNTVVKGDVLFNRTSETADEIGLSAVYDGKDTVTFGGFVIRARVKPNVEDLDHDFKRYCFRTSAVRRQIIAAGQGGIRTNIGQGDLSLVKLQFPPLPEQRAIAACLGTWDRAIDALQQMIAAKEQRKRWLMQVLLTGKKRLKGFEGEWEEVRLGEVTKSVSRRNKNLSDAKVYSVTNTSAGFVPQSEHFDREVAGDDRANHKIIHHGEFAYNPARINVGSIAQFKGKVGIISSLYVIFRTDDELMDSFLHYWLQTDLARYRIESYGEGGVRVYLFYNLFSTIKILLPSLEEQQAISEVLLTADRELELLRAKLDRLRDEKRGLMQVLLTGRKRLNN